LWENCNPSVNLPQLVECYATIGVAGVIVGMFVIGLVYRMPISLYVHPGMGPRAVVAAVYVSSKLFGIGTPASMVFLRPAVGDRGGGDFPSCDRDGGNRHDVDREA
jgi:hypothetical protein